MPLTAAGSLPDKCQQKGLPWSLCSVLSYYTTSSPMARRPKSPHVGFNLFWPTEGSRSDIQQVLARTSRGDAHFHSLLVTFHHYVMQPGLADCHAEPPSSSPSRPRQGPPREGTQPSSAEFMWHLTTDVSLSPRRPEEPLS